jgi:hypothetical protein
MVIQQADFRRAFWLEAAMWRVELNLELSVDLAMKAILIMLLSVAAQVICHLEHPLQSVGVGLGVGLEIELAARLLQFLGVWRALLIGMGSKSTRLAALQPTAMPSAPDSSSAARLLPTPQSRWRWMVARHILRSLLAKSFS